ncbi:MAG: MarR family transcriptional regulator [Alphaproteobacteria bacterium]|nr:MAG: MarR family transcriptional regulator [Alphaproteobacteria bacterium]
MRTIEEILVGRDLTAEEFRILDNFWIETRELQRRRDRALTKNRYLVSIALSTRRVKQQELDIEGLASLTGLGRSSLQTTLKKMAEDNMVKLVKDPADRRRTLVKPTRDFTGQSLDMYEETRDLIRRTYAALQAVRIKK